MTNKVKDFRKKLGMTQKQLADTVGTSQQQIQRIENMVQSTRLDLAIKICQALNTTLEKVFPKTGRPVAKALEKAKHPEEIMYDDDLSKALSPLGIDVDPLIHTLRMRFSSGFEIAYQLTSSEQARMWSVLQDYNESDPFVAFDSMSTRVLINRNHLFFYQFLCDPLYAEQQEDIDEQERQVKVFFSNSIEPAVFDVDTDEIFEDDDEEIGQFSHLIFMAENYAKGDQLTFLDEDGERVFLIAEHVAIMEIPLCVVEPKLLEEDDENDVNDEIS